jgi:hypothetical protein
MSPTLVFDSYRSDRTNPRSCLRRKIEIAFSTDRDIEASLSIDESGYPVAQVARNLIQPARGTRPFLLIVRTGRIVTTHVVTLRTGCDVNEYRRIHGVSSK